MAVLVIHTTEGGWQSALSTFAKEPGKQPHRLIDPLQNVFKDYIAWTRPAKALKNLAGGVETNNRGAVYQVEIVGFSRLMPTMSDTWYLTLARQLIDICKTTGTPVKFPCPFNSNKDERLSNSNWLTVEGIIGHMHVPENDHTDPGDISRVIPFMLALLTGEDPMYKGIGQDKSDVEALYFLRRDGRVPQASEVLYWLGECMNARKVGRDVDTVLASLDNALLAERR